MSALECRAMIKFGFDPKNEIRTYFLECGGE